MPLVAYRFRAWRITNPLSDRDHDREPAGWLAGADLSPAASMQTRHKVQGIDRSR